MPVFIGPPPGWYPTSDLRTIAQDTPSVRIDVLENDRIGKDVSEATIQQITTPAHGVASLDENGQTIVYVPDRGYLGIDNFQYTFSTSEGSTYTVDVVLNIVKPFVAIDDWYRIDPNSEPRSLMVTGNDRTNAKDLEPAVFSIADLSLPAHGKVELDDDGRSVLYTPDEGFVGLDQFTYRLRDAAGHESEATVKLRVAERPTGYSEWQLGRGQALWSEELEFELQWVGLHRIDFVAGDAEPIYSPPTLGWLQPTSGGFGLSNGNSSSTNHVPLDGIAEADIVRAQGNYLFIVSNADQYSDGPHQLVVVNTQDPKNPAVVARIDFQDNVLDLFLFENQLFVISEEGTFHQQRFNHFLNDEFAVTVFDISGATPQVLHETVVEGTYKESKAIGENVYIIAQQKPLILRIPEAEKQCVPGLNACFYETVDQYLERVRDTIATISKGNDFVSFISYDAEGNVLERGEIKGSSPYETADEKIDPSLENNTTVLSFLGSGGTQGPVDVEFLRNETTTIYASRDSLYLARSHSTEGLAASTTIDKLKLEADGSNERVASGTVPNRILNQFSLDEHDGFLRVASGNLVNGGTQISILEQHGDQLEIVGKIEDVAPSERLYSSRFIGDFGYVVTFGRSQIRLGTFSDPLYTLDLSDPHAPRIVGELEIPGYSQYLLPLDSQHLLGIGRDANELTGVYEEMHVQLFGVDDLSNPELLHRYSFDGDRNMWSPLVDNEFDLGDHQSISYFTSHEILAIPMYRGVQYDVANSGYYSTEKSIHLLKIDLDAGISSLGVIPLSGEFNMKSVRTLMIEDSFYAIAGNRIQVFDLNDPARKHAELKLVEFVQPNPPRQPSWCDPQPILVVQPEPLQTLNQSTEWADFNGDGHVTHMDLLIQINFINRFGTGSNAEVDGRAQLADAEEGNQYSSELFDLNQDQFVTPLDVLWLVNVLNDRDDSEETAEGESEINIPGIDSVFADPFQVYLVD